MKKFKSRELKGQNRCKFHRTHNLHLESGKKTENVYSKATIIKEEIKKAIAKKSFDEDAVWDILKEKFLELDYPTEETALRQAEDALFQIKRYVISELTQLASGNRKIAFNPGKKLIDIESYCTVEVIPDYIFRGIREFDEKKILPSGRVKKETVIKPYIEIVKLCASKPNVTQNGSKIDESSNASLELYSMIRYARTLLTPKDKGIEVVASYYFLRSNRDSSDVYLDFFDIPKGGNIVSIRETNDYFGFNSKEMDALFIPQIREFLLGVDTCSKDVCKKCEFYKLCNYTKPPKYSEKEKKVKELSDLSLTDQQEAAIGFRKGIARINAGAGAGKTLVTTLRVASMLEEGIDPKDICMLTFSVSGTEEMRERIRLYAEDLGVESSVDDLTVMTFHSFGNEIIQENYKMFDFTEPPTLIDDIERYSIIAKILKENVVRDLDYKNFRMNFPYVKGALHVGAKAFEIIKRERLSVGDEEKLKDFMKDAGYPCSIDALSDLFELYTLYNEEMKKNNKLEYSDQELLILELLDENPYYFEDHAYKHIIVDEFQDTSPNQFEILRYMIDTPSFESFMVVGDDSQSIYAFRGSDPKFIIHFYDNLKKMGQDFFLLENHRSTPEIIDFANKMNELNINRVEKDLIATRNHGAPVVVKQFWDKNSDKKKEFDYITDSILHLHKEKNVDYEDIAFIAFSRDTLLKMGTACTEKGIPWILLNPEPMLENSRVSACIALAKFTLDNTATIEAFEYLNAVSKNTLISTATDDEILKKIEELGTQTQFILSLNDIESFKALVDDLDDDDELFDTFVNTIFQKGSLTQILDYCVNFSIYGENQRVRRERNYPGVVLTTAHSSKGMEWNYVFNSLSDYHTKRLQVQHTEERRRLVFVSATRARDELVITGQSIAYGKKDNYTYNRFLEDSFRCIGESFDYTNPNVKKH